MGFANKHLDKIRKIGRKYVLPSDEIKSILESRIDFSKLGTIVDFGAGTLFWSEYFPDKLLTLHNNSNKRVNGAHNKSERLLRALSKALEFAGVNAIYFYIAQGFSSSLLLKIAPQFSMWWGIKLALCFCINLALCVVFVYILKLFFEKTRLIRYAKGKSHTYKNSQNLPS